MRKQEIKTVYIKIINDKTKRFSMNFTNPLKNELDNHSKFKKFLNRIFY